ncbi:prepilin-type cleavage/methylation domain-containing protein, partial [Pseudoalteromonas sp. S1649]
YSDDMQVNVAWVDKRLPDYAELQISLNGSFPDLPEVWS